MWKAMGLAVGLVLAGTALAAAAGTEVQLPDGHTAILYDDHTWEIKRPAPEVRADTVEVDALVKNPGKFAGQEVVVTGTIARMLGAYRLQSNSEQNTIVLDIEQARRADQIALEQAISSAGFGNSVRVQAQGLVEQSLTTSRLVAAELIVLGE
jgi:hypothetical protein